MSRVEKLSKVDMEEEPGGKEGHQEQGDRDEDDPPQGGSVRAGRSVVHLNCPLGRLLVRHWLGYSVVMSG